MGTRLSGLPASSKFESYPTVSSPPILSGKSTLQTSDVARPPVRPSELAAYAVMSRLISCLVTEQILRAVYIPFDDGPKALAHGLMVVLSFQTTSEGKLERPLCPDDVFILVPLHHSPVVQGDLLANGKSIGLVDPLDMLPSIYEFGGKELHAEQDEVAGPILSCLASPTWNMTSRVALRNINDPVSLWRKFSNGYTMEDTLREVIDQEILSSFEWQAKAYENPPLCPIISSSAVEWEQSLVAGHPTHPMHRARMFKSISLSYDWYHPRIRFVRVPRTDIELLGNFEEISNTLIKEALKNTQDGRVVSDGFIFMPVHELQVENIKAKFENVEVLSPQVSLPSLAQSSIRTVEIPQFPGLAFKLAVGVKISSALRTISHFTANFGPRFSRDIVPKLAVNSAILAVELETSSASYRTSNPELAKHFTAVIREEYQAPKGQTLIVVAALLETGHAGVPPGVSAIEHVFDLNTDEKKTAFLERYIQIACQALIPALVKNGVAFEAHAQNVLARFDVDTKELRGFVVRDLGGLRIHPATLRKSTGVDFQFLPGHVVATQTLEEIFPKFYHTFVHNHIQRLIRLLGMHYDGRGWEILRRHMAAVIPRDHPVWKTWMDPESATVDSKCLMRMRMRDSYRDMVYSPYPNLIQYRPQIAQKETR